MITKEQLLSGYALNIRLIKRQTDGLTHADSLTLSPYNINTLNWVLGHICVARDRALVLLGEEPVLTDDERACYETGSEPVREASQAVMSLERLLEVLETGQERINAGFERLTEADMQREVQVGEQSVAVGARLFGLYFHDTYHTGQTDLLRQVAGKNDKVI
jgi:hypothetical protein